MNYYLIMKIKNICPVVFLFLISFLIIPEIIKGDEMKESVNKFNFDLFEKFIKGNFGENVFFSPFSIYSAIGMVYEGSKGETKEELEKVFYFCRDEKKRRNDFKIFTEEINKKDKNFVLEIANGIWIQKNFKVLKKYLKLVEKCYLGKAKNLDFALEPENSRKIINDWVEEKTMGKIKDLIPEGYLNYLVKMVLTNAIYFKGFWLQKFDKNFTKDEDFIKRDGKVIKVPMMRIAGLRFNYGEGDNFQILQLSYEGEKISMVLLLPKIDKISEFENNLNYENYREWKGLLKNRKVDIFIPKFKFNSKYYLSSILKERGMKKSFTPEADFSGITGKKDLMVSEVIHQGFIQVDEEGTEAAAATGVVMRVTSVLPERIPQFKADHTFYFFIEHKETETILFSGKVEEPKN